jgi:predicted DsbA family dithiol-disulfide isomerase
MFARVTQAGARYGVRFDWEQVRRAPDTAPAHALLDAAPAEKRRALLEALHHAYFLRGENIGDPAVLASLAVDVSPARDAARLADVRARAARASAEGIRGVPHFRFGGARSLHGAQSPEALRQALQATA